MDQRNLRLTLLALAAFVIGALMVPDIAQEAMAQGREFMGWVIADQLTVEGPAEFNDPVTITGNLTQTGNQTVTGDYTVTGDLSLTGNMTNRSLFLRYQDVAAAPSIRAAAGVVSATTSITTSILGIDVPRNVVLTWQTTTTATAGNVTVAGVDARGNSTTELVAVGAVSGTQTLTGVVPWASVSSLTLPTRTEAVTLTVAGGQLFGLPLIPQAAGDVYHVTVNATPQANPTVSATYGTFDPVSTPAANVDYNVWVKQ